MRQKSGKLKEPAEKVVKDIRRATRSQASSVAGSDCRTRRCIWPLRSPLACESAGLLYLAMDWRGHDKLVRAAKSVELRHINTCVWDKGRGGMGGFYRSQHELFGVFKKGKAPHLNNIQLAKYGRNRTNVWSYPGVRASSPSMCGCSGRCAR